MGEETTEEKERMRFTGITLKDTVDWGCVESGVLTISFWKPYEIMSWNGQGEITQITGMLIITFCVVFSLSPQR